jgi:Homeodomain-like domain
MRGPRPMPCIFPDGFLQDAMNTVRRRTASVQDVQRFRLVLLLHERPSISHEDAAEIVGLSARQVQRWRRRWTAGDFSIEDYPGRGRKPTFSPGRSSGRHRDGVRGRRRIRIAHQPAIGR